MPQGRDRRRWARKFNLAASAEALTGVVSGALLAHPERNRNPEMANIRNNIKNTFIIW
jgi:hypothetical protein